MDDFSWPAFPGFCSHATVFSPHGLFPSVIVPDNLRFIAKFFPSGETGTASCTMTLNVTSGAYRFLIYFQENIS
jgi:hypothetical protein